jgi:hypothetical protein
MERQSLSGLAHWMKLNNNPEPKFVWQLLRKLQQQILATIEEAATADSGNY